MKSTILFILSILPFLAFNSIQAQRLVGVKRWISPVTKDYTSIPENKGTTADLTSWGYTGEVFQYQAFLDRPSGNNIAVVNRWEMPNCKEYILIAEHEISDAQMTSWGYKNKEFVFYAYRTRPLGGDWAAVNRWVNAKRQGDNCRDFTLSVTEYEYTDEQLTRNGYTDKKTQFYIPRSAEAGRVLWTKNTDFLRGSSEWAGIGNNYPIIWPQNIGLLYSAGGGVFYSIDNNGNLLWIKHRGYNNGANSWYYSEPRRVAEGWNRFRKIICAENGIIYCIDNQGDLYWYKHLGYNDGSARWEGGVKVGNGGWDKAKLVLWGGNGVLYVIDNVGDMFWYKHLGHQAGTVQWEGGLDRKIGSGWNDTNFSGIYGSSGIFGANEGVFFAVKKDSGDLVWYRHIGIVDGSARWEGGLSHKIHNFYKCELIYGGNGIFYYNFIIQ